MWTEISSSSIEIDDVDSAAALLFNSFTVNVNKECEH